MNQKQISFLCRKNPVSGHWTMILFVTLLLSYNVNGGVITDSLDDGNPALYKSPGADDASKPVEGNIAGKIIREIGSPLRQETFSIFPNPAERLLNIRSESIPSGPVALEIFDVTGRLVYSSQFSSGKDDTLVIQLDPFRPGYYFLRIMADNTLLTFRFIKK